MFVSIITVNFNGKKLLKNFLDSAYLIDYPPDKYEVIVVDNGSTDGSVAYIKNNFPEVKTIESTKNLGFGGGNNLGIKHAKGDLYYLINNDTEITKKAIKNSVDCFNKWSEKGKVGAVTSKLLLYDSYIPIELRGAYLADYIVKSTPLPVNKKPLSRRIDTGTSMKEEVMLPFSHELHDKLEIELVLSKVDSNKFEIFTNDNLYFSGHFARSNDHQNIDLIFTKNDLEKYRRNLFQNAGNFYFRDGHGRDRGVYVIQNQQYYEIDHGQYDNDELVPGFNGAAVLLNKNALKEVGMFDEKFFMYYEDGDLSLRMYKSGWNVLYCHDSVIRHIHSASSKEFSDFFIYHTERNRLLFVIKHWPLPKVFRQCLSYFVRDLILVNASYFVRGEAGLAFKRFIIRSKVLISLVFQIIVNLFNTDRLSKIQVKKFY
jgi:O-antigen biosynthesis protein